LRTPECSLNIRGSLGWGLLDSAINQPRQSFDGCDLYPTLVDKAAILLWSLAKNHAFDDGNKRFATAATAVFLDINGYFLDVDEDELVAWVEWIASPPSPSWHVVAWWLAQKIAPLT